MGDNVYAPLELTYIWSHYSHAKNGKVRLLRSCQLFITPTKHSNLFLLDRHQTECARCQ